MDNKEKIIKILSVLNESLAEETMPVQKLTAEGLEMTEPEYSRLIEMLLDAGLIKGFHPISKMGQRYSSYKLINPNLTLRGIEYLEANK